MRRPGRLPAIFLLFFFYALCGIYIEYLISSRPRQKAQVKLLFHDDDEFFVLPVGRIQQTAVPGVSYLPTRCANRTCVLI